MGAKDIINKFKANAILILKDEVIHTDSFGEIPKKWIKFMDSQNEWRGIDLGSSTTNILFKGLKEDQVAKHVHRFSDERTFVLSGKVEVISESGIKIYNEGDSFFIEKGIYHIVNFLENSTLLAIFSPEMKGLEIEFKE